MKKYIVAMFNSNKETTKYLQLCNYINCDKQQVKRKTPTTSVFNPFNASDMDEEDANGMRDYLNSKSIKKIDGFEYTSSFVAII